MAYLSGAMLRAAAAFLAFAVLAHPARAGERPLAVVELFTSQGCSSCPPADAFLSELAPRPGVLALSVHVDYWDYIGWKDPFASPDHTRRQRDYARQFGLRYIYTPQMVVQGGAQHPGTEREAVEAEIAKAAARPGPTLVLVRREGGPVVRLPAAAGQPKAVVLAVLFDREHVTAIQRGENGGRTIRNSHVVREMRRLAVWDGAAAELALPWTPGAGQGCAVLLQALADGRILAAAALKPGS
jgi:hypothetical protein